uniref:Cathelicidin-like peptide 5 n=1 Tax=Pelodiscus sinensis TaxID=13735 RepID=A0A2Z4HVL9_PELSI|nr:cathelicidin-like peptide 5 [Pelodiscus sinensis]
METCLKILLLVGVVTAAPTSPASSLPSHEDAILAAVQVYNQEPGVTLAYRLLEAEPQPDWDVTSKTVQPLKFTIKETVCLISEKRDSSQCEFKEDGVSITRCLETLPLLFCLTYPNNISRKMCVPHRHIKEGMVLWDSAFAAVASLLSLALMSQTTPIHPTPNYRTAWFLFSGLLGSAGVLFFLEAPTEVRSGG